MLFIGHHRVTGDARHHHAIDVIEQPGKPAGFDVTEPPGKPAGFEVTEQPG